MSNSFNVNRENAERRAREMRENAERRAAEMRANAERRDAEMRISAERRAREMQEHSERRAREMQEHSERRNREMRENAERRATEMRDNAERRLREQQKSKERGFSKEGYYSIFSILGDTAMKDLFDRRSFEAPTTDTQSKPEDAISRAELIRRRVLLELPPEKQKTLETFDQMLVNGVIATVSRAREVDPERQDWDIHLAYRRAIEVEQPDPLMIQKTQISGILIEGRRAEAHYPF